MDNYNQFRTSTGQIISGEALQQACNQLAVWYDNQAVLVRQEDCFDSHVTQAAKDDYIKRYYTDTAQAVRERSNLANFTIWQKLNTILTGECVAFLPAGEAQ